MDTDARIVQLIYDFEPEDNLEREAFKELVGSQLYSAVMVYKNAGKEVEIPIKFIEKMNDKFNVTDLM